MKCRRYSFITGSIVFLALMLLNRNAFADNVLLKSLNENRVSLALKTSEHDRDIFEYDDMTHHEATLERKFMELSFGLGDITDISLRLGQMAWKLNFTGGGTFDFGSAWGAGARVKITETEYPKLTVSCVMEYNHGTPEDNELSMPFEGDIKEWLIGIETRHAVNNLQLFGGINYSQVSLTYRHAGTFGRREGGYEEDNNLGLFAGCEWYVVPQLSLSAILKIMDQDGLDMGLTYHF